LIDLCRYGRDGDAVSFGTSGYLGKYLWSDAVHDALKHHGTVLASSVEERLIYLRCCSDLVHGDFAILRQETGIVGATDKHPL
jgi:hypothetical protein